MPFTPEEISRLKNQLKEQLKHLPAEKRKESEEHLDEMSDESIELMLEQQKSSQKPIFRAIISNELPSKKIDENESAIAVLDIKPITKGHTIIIPKQLVKDEKEFSTQILEFVKQVAKNIEFKLKLKDIEIKTEFKFGESIINIIPVYDKSVSLKSPRSELSEKEAEELEKLLTDKSDKKIVVKLENENDEVTIHPKLKRRIP